MKARRGSAPLPWSGHGWRIGRLVNALGDRAGEAVGAGGMGSAEPFPSRETTTQRPGSGNESTGDRYGVGGGQRTHPPGPRRGPRPPRAWSVRE